MKPSPSIDAPSLAPAELPDLTEADWTDSRASTQARRAAQARHHSKRRPFIDPTTCDRDYDTDELEFMDAMHAYKHSSGRMFPTWSEVLEVLRDLGYRKADGSDTAPTDG